MANSRYRITIGYQDGRRQIINPTAHFRGNAKDLVATVAGRNAVKFFYIKKS